MILRIEYYLFNFLLCLNFLFVFLNIKNDKYWLNIWGKKIIRKFYGLNICIYDFYF